MLIGDRIQTGIRKHLMQIISINWTKN